MTSKLDNTPRTRPLARLLGAASALALATVPQAAFAQGDPAPAPAVQPPEQGGAAEGETIVVTGFRGSLTAALGAKRNDNGIVDVIVAEDIADFPDQNLAESLQRIPGIAIDRDAGEGRQISVRGLGGDFTRVRLNQLEALATTGGTDSSGGANRSRAFDFNVFASELFSRLTVRKSASAEVDEGSLGATVDLTTGRPFDYNRFVISASGQMGYNDLARDWSPRGAFLVSDTFMDGRFGILFSIAYSRRDLFEEGFSSVRWDAGNSVGGFCSPVGHVPLNPTAGGANCGANPNIPGFTAPPRLPNTPGNQAEYDEASLATNVHPRLPRYGRLTHEQERIGATLALQARPWDGALFTADILYARLNATRQEDFLEAISFSRTAAQGGKPQTSVVQAEYDANGNLLFGIFNGVDIRSESRFDELTTDFWQYQLQWDQEVTDRLRFTWLAGRSTSDFNNPVQTTTTLDAPNVNGYTIDFRESRGQPTITYPFDPTSTAGPLVIIGTPAGVTPSNITPSEIRIRPQGANNEFTTFRGDVAWDAIPDRITLKGGFFYRNYDFSTFEFRRVNQNDTILALPAGTPLSAVTTVLTGFGRGLNLGGGTPTSWLIPDLNAIAALYNIYCNCLQSGNAGGPGDYTLSSTTNGNARGNNRAVREEDIGGYAQFDFRTELLGRPLRGNIGLRYVRTDVRAAGYQALGGGTLTVVNRSYDDWLPSANVAWDVASNFVVRLAAARVMARPQLGNLSPGGTINTTGQLSITTGNPLLEPFRATTVDASFEWYFAPESLISVGLFYKDIGTFIQTLRTEIPYNQTGLPLSLIPANFTGNELFLVTAPINTSGGPLKGFELNFQAPFRFLPGFARNFGTILNFTYVESEIEYVTSATNAALIRDDLVNLSPRSWNATLYYDDGRFSIRGSVAYRSDYLQRVPAQNVVNDVEGKNSTLNVDASASFAINDHITLTAEAINLTDEFNDQFVDRDRNSPSVVHHTGRQFYLGARVRF
jgi:iron complex outermembrane recepter protein